MRSVIGRRTALLLVTACTLAFVVNCADSTSPRLGAIRVTMATQGIDLDANGYRLTLDGSRTMTIGVLGSQIVNRIAYGDHKVLVDGAAPNCRIDGENPRTVSVTADQTAEVAFTAACVLSTGSISIQVTTDGVDQDLDGYHVIIDNGSSYPLSTNGIILLSDLGRGSHTVRLIDQSPNCSVRDGAERTVMVPPELVAFVGFHVMCVAPFSGANASRVPRFRESRRGT